MSRAHGTQRGGGSVPALASWPLRAWPPVATAGTGEPLAAGEEAPMEGTGVRPQLVAAVVARGTWEPRVAAGSTGTRAGGLGGLWLGHTTRHPVVLLRTATTSSGE